MAQPISMPKLGLTMNEGTVSRWNVAEGASVAAGDVLFVVSTDKLTYEFQAPEACTILKILAPEGATLPVGQTVAFIGQEGEEIPAGAVPAAQAAPTDPASAPSTTSAPPAEFQAGKKSVVVIGGGPGGYVCAIRLAQLGAAVTLIERARVGGVCLNVGCIPTKALVQSAERYTEVRGAAIFGVHCNGVRFDWGEIQARKDAIVNQLTVGVAGLLAANGVTVVSGEAHFISDSSIDVAGVEYRADAFVVATGSQSVVPPIPGIKHPSIVTSTEALSFEAVPASLLIVGGGVIGLEFGCVYAALGSKVTVVEMMPTILPMADGDVIATVRRRLESQGIVFYTSSKVTSFKERSNGVTVAVETPEGPRNLSAEKVLLSIGRRPDTASLNLEAAGVTVNRGRIIVNDRLETSTPGIYAIGDCASPIMLAHVASAEGECVAGTIMGEPRAMDYRTAPSCVFTVPEVAWVGLTEEAARAQHKNVNVGRFPLLANGRCLVMNDTDGFVKIVTGGVYDEVLGVHIVGPRATDLIVEGALALRLEATANELVSTIHSHPTVGEALGEAAMAVHRRAIHVPPVS